MANDNKKANLKINQSKFEALIERAYNACIADGFKPYDESDPLAKDGAITECAARTQQKPQTILELLKEKKIAEKSDGFNFTDPQAYLRARMGAAGISLAEAPNQDNDEFYKPADISGLKKAALIQKFQLLENDLMRTRRAAQSRKATIDQLRRDVNGLRSTNRILQEKGLSTQEIYAKVTEQFIKPVNPIPFPHIIPSKDKRPLIPSVILSDVHWGEVATPEGTMGINAYNPDIAMRRLQQFTEGVIRVCDDHATEQTNYQGIVVNLGGDIISGNIHEELTRTNRTRTMRDDFGQDTTYSASCFDQALEASEALTPVIDAFTDRFGVVKVPLVVGNHGRNGKPYFYNGHVHDSFDYLVGKLLERHYAKNPKVQIIVSESTDLMYDIYTSRFLLTHGDRMGVKGGDGIIGSMGPIMRGNKKVRDHYSNYAVTYHYMLMGHWHQYQAQSNLVVNGSLVGPNAHSSDNRYNPEPPQQALFMVHPLRGILYHHPITCDDSYRHPRFDPMLPPPSREPNFERPFIPLLGYQGARPTMAPAA